MTPLEKIRDWLAGIPEQEARKEIAFFVLSLNDDTENFWTLEIEPVLDRWLTPERTSSSIVVGRAIAFREALKFSVSNRFSGKGWEMPERMFREVLEEAERDPASTAASMAKHAREMLDNLPRRVEMWKRIGASWTPFVEAELSDEALRKWYDRRMMAGIGERE